MAIKLELQTPYMLLMWNLHYHFLNGHRNGAASRLICPTSCSKVDVSVSTIYAARCCINISFCTHKMLPIVISL